MDYPMLQIIKQNRLNFIILIIWFYLGAIMDLSASTLGFITIGIEHEGNPRIVEAWNSNYFLFNIEYLIRHIGYLFLLLGSMLLYLYIKLNFDFKGMKVLKFGIFLSMAGFTTFGLFHWCYGWIWLILIMFDGEIPNSLQTGFGLYFSLIFIAVAFSFFITLGSVRRFFIQEYELIYNG